MANFWTQKSGTKLATLQESVTTTVSLPLSESLATTTVISGNLPAGMRLRNNIVEGTPYEVARNTEYKFVVRAVYNNQISDRTFIIEVQGADEPVWQTEEGLLPIGSNNTFYILDSSPVDYQLVAIDTDTAAGETLEFFIGSGDGTLPPGIELTNDGRIVGIVDPILAIEKRIGTGSYDTGGYDSNNNPYDFGIKPSNGYDSFFYDTTIYDLAIPTKSPKKLNRYYEFTVSVSDGDTIARRTFRIFVVGDDFLRVDNTIMQVGTGVFTADNTHIRTPIWLTPRNFGFRRANNYVTLYLDIIDPNTLSGFVSYALDTVNDDGTPSTLPPGMSIDSTTGEIAGRVPYQPSVNVEYKFTVTATRYGPTSNREFVTLAVYEDAPIGSSTIKIIKNPDILDVLEKNISIGGGSYKIIAVDDSNLDYDVITIGDPVTVTLFASATTPATSVDIFKLGAPFLENLIGKTFNVGAQPVTVSSVDYKHKYYRARATHKSKAFAADIGNSLWEEISTPSDPDAINLWGQDISYNVDSIVKYNPGRFETINLAVPTSINLFAGTSVDVGLDGSTTAITKANTTYSIQVVSDVQSEVASSTKTFTVTLLGDVDSKITFLTDGNLGNISANYISTLLIEATTSVPRSRILYSLVAGKLPPGLNLAFDGSISGKINQFGTDNIEGMTTFDTTGFILDGNSTTIDRKFTFTVSAQDQFGYSAQEKQFTITVGDPDNKLYSNLFVKPFLKREQRVSFNTFISNPDIFDPDYIYRPFDSNFGLQTELKMLVYAGLETQNVNEYVAAAAKNHKRKKFKLGEIKTAVAKTPGTNDVVYEVVYIDVKDPYMPIKGKARNNYKIKTSNTIRTSQSQTGVEAVQSVVIPITGRSGSLGARLTQGQLQVILRGGSVTIGNSNSLNVTLRNTTSVTTNGTVTLETPEITAPYVLKPNVSNTIKADTNAVDASFTKDDRRYISNVDNMRDNLSRIGLTEYEFLPLWMRSNQEDTLQELGYVTAIPLCYCKPGTGKIIQNAIKFFDFDFNQFDFDIDRYIIDNTIGNSDEQYILFANYQFNV